MTEQNISKIIQTKRLSMGYNKTELARRLGISSQLIGHYESGRSKPKAEFYLKWKNEFGEDLLAHLGDSNVSEISINENIRAVRIAQRQELDTFYAYSNNMSVQRMKEIEDGIVQPTIEEVRSISRYFNIPLQEILERDLRHVYHKDYYSFVGVELKRIREASGISSAELAEFLRIDKKMLKDIEDKKALPDNHRLRTLENFFSLTRMEEIQGVEKLPVKKILDRKVTTYPSYHSWHGFKLGDEYKKITKRTQKIAIHNFEDIKLAREWNDLTMYQVAKFTQLSKDRIESIENGGVESKDEDYRTLKTFFEEYEVSLYAWEERNFPDYISEKDLRNAIVNVILDSQLSNEKLSEIFREEVSFFEIIRNEKRIPLTIDEFRMGHLHQWAKERSIPKYLGFNFSELDNEVHLNTFISVPYLYHSHSDHYFQWEENGKSESGIPMTIIPRPPQKGNYITIINDYHVMSDEFPILLTDMDLLLCKELPKYLWESKVYHTKYPVVIFSNERQRVGILSKYDKKNGTILLRYGINNTESDIFEIASIKNLFYVIKIVDRTATLLNIRS
ncbi:MAG: helix-turn-helix domain-containing protein [Agriterribacter sp.]